LRLRPKKDKEEKGTEMKRTLAILLIIVFTAALCVNVAAQDEDLNGYEFNILAVDEMITAENGLILTSESTLANREPAGRF
jgi:hypothetical protein